MSCQFEYIIEKEADRHIDIATSEAIARDSWSSLDTLLFQGRSRIIISDVCFEYEGVYLLNFSANWIFALRGLVFYSCEEERVHIEESSAFLKLRLRNAIVEIESFPKEGEPRNKFASVDVISLLREAAVAHMALVSALFKRIPRIQHNRSFMDGYPDARLISQLRGVPAQPNRCPGHVVISLKQ